MKTGRFDHKVVLVTGAASGIGHAAARAFAAEGAKVMLADRAGEKVAANAEEIRRDGGAASSFAVDVTDYAACQAMVSYTVEEFGGLHVAFNNAGIPSTIDPEFEQCRVEDWDRVINVNLNSVFYAMKAETPALRASGGTAIVNTASVASFVASPGVSAYTASKHGVAGLTKAAALDLIRHGIRVNAVCPGVVNTPMLGAAAANPEVIEAMQNSIPIGRIASPEEIARLVLFAASEEANYMVGSLIRVDGGISLP